jgi:4-hydroxybenzoate polyprenyltransferase
VFFYPFAMAHLGVNDLIDIANDRVRQLRTIPVLYGINGTVFWIGGFSIFHAITAAVFFQYTGMIAGMGMITGLILLLVANILILRGRDPDSAMKTLPLFHVTMVVYAGAILLDAARRLGVW